jgi:DHA1 family bicyclomycin/chloramphenicol resistance-like MFS transporter
VVRFLDRTTAPHLVTLVSVAALASLSMSFYLPSLPAMTDFFHTEYRVMQLSVSLYLVGNAVLQLVVGPLSDRFGRRPVLIGGIVVFVLATLICVFARTIEMFLIGRMIQSAVVVANVLSRAVVRDIHDESRSASMIGYVMMFTSIMPMIGPTLGGVIDAAFGWQGVFWALFGVSVLALALVWADLGETAQSRGRPFRAQLAEYPLLLRAPRFWGYTVCSAATSGMFFAFLGGAPFVGVEIFGLTPTQLGIGLGIPAVGYMLGNFLSARLSMALGVNRMVLGGTLIAASGIAVQLALFGLGLGGPVVFFGGMIVMTIGNGMVLPNSVAGLLSVRPQLAGSASGLSGAMQIGGGALFAALAGWMLTEDSGATPLLALMLFSGLLATAAILFVIRRSRRRGLG